MCNDTVNYTGEPNALSAYKNQQLCNNMYITTCTHLDGPLHSSQLKPFAVRSTFLCSHGISHLPFARGSIVVTSTQLTPLALRGKAHKKIFLHHRTFHAVRCKISCCLVQII